MDSNGRLQLALAMCLAGLTLVIKMRSRSAVRRVMGLKEQLGSADFQTVLTAYHVVAEAYTRYKPEQLALAFNGGKDCMIVFQLVKAYCTEKSLPMPLLVHFHVEDEFPELTHFMEGVLANHPQLTIVRLGSNMKQCLKSLGDEYHIAGVFMGQRSSDPYCPKLHFAPTDPDWPEMMRINPILEFNYSVVWRFIKGTGTEYCKLYDMGYTSLGPKSRTSKNPLLETEDMTHRPAHELIDVDFDERDGRS